MKEINIREETEKFLFSWFKKFEGKYIYFTYKTYDKNVELMNVFFVEEVALRNEKAKAKVGKFKMEENRQLRCRWGLIRSLKYKWVVIDKKELKKLLILENLK